MHIPRPPARASQQRHCVFLLPGLLSALLIAAVCLPGCGEPGDADAGRTATATAPAAPVVVAKATREDVPLRIDTVGVVKAFQVVVIKPQVTGLVTDVHFAQGQKVEPGDLLFSLDARPFQATLRVAEATLEKDRALAAEAEWTAERTHRLYKESIDAELGDKQARSAADAAKATVVADEAAVDAAKLDVDYCSIRSPVAGYVGVPLVDAGNVVAVKDTEMVSIRQVQPVYVEFAVPERHLQRIRVARRSGPKQVEAFPLDGPDSVTGTLDFLDNTVSTQTGTITLRGKFDNADERLWPGMFVRTFLDVEVLHDAVVVPAQAVKSGQRGSYVFVVKPDMTVEMHDVEVGYSFRGRTVIDSGVEAGQTVVTDGQLRLVPGARVAIASKGDSGGGDQASSGGQAVE